MTPDNKTSSCDHGRLESDEVAAGRKRRDEMAERYMKNWRSIEPSMLGISAAYKDGYDAGRADAFRCPHDVENAQECFTCTPSPQPIITGGIGNFEHGFIPRSEPTQVDCYECRAGFPIDEDGHHYGTQALGMIPSTPCKIKPTQAEMRDINICPNCKQHWPRECECTSSTKFNMRSQNEMITFKKDGKMRNTAGLIPIEDVRLLLDAINSFNKAKWVFDNEWRGKEDAQKLYKALAAFYAKHPGVKNGL